MIYLSWENRIQMQCVLMRDIIAHLLPISCHVWRLVKTELLVSERKAASLSSPRLRPGQQSQPVTPTVPSCRGGGKRSWGLTGRYCQQARCDLRLKLAPNLPCPSGECHFLQEWVKVWFQTGEGSLLGCSPFTHSSFNGSTGILEEIPQSWKETQSKQRLLSGPETTTIFTHCSTW